MSNKSKTQEKKPIYPFTKRYRSNSKIKKIIIKQPNFSMHKHLIHDRQIIDVKSNKLGIEKGIG